MTVFAATETMGQNHMVDIQFQDSSGMWFTVMSVEDNPQEIIMQMKNLSRMKPGFRIRAVDQHGRVVDIL